MSDREMGGWVDADVPGRWGPLARRPPQSFVLKMCSVCGHSAEGPPPGQGCREEAGRAVVLSAMMGPCRACGGAGGSWLGGLGASGELWRGRRGRLVLGLSSLGRPTRWGGPSFSVSLPFPLPHSDPRLRPRPLSCLSFPPCRAGLVWPLCSVAALVFSPCHWRRRRSACLGARGCLCPTSLLWPCPSPPPHARLLPRTSRTCASRWEPLPGAGWAKFGPGWRLHAPLSGCPWRDSSLGGCGPGRVWAGEGASSPAPALPPGRLGRPHRPAPSPPPQTEPDAGEGRGHPRPGDPRRGGGRRHAGPPGTHPQLLPRQHAQYPRLDHLCPRGGERAGQREPWALTEATPGARIQDLPPSGVGRAGSLSPRLGVVAGEVPSPGLTRPPPRPSWCSASPRPASTSRRCRRAPCTPGTWTRT